MQPNGGGWTLYLSYENSHVISEEIWFANLKRLVPPVDFVKADLEPTFFPNAGRFWRVVYQAALQNSICT